MEQEAVTPEQTESLTDPDGGVPLGVECAWPWHAPEITKGSDLMKRLIIDRKALRFSR